MKRALATLLLLAAGLGIVHASYAQLGGVEPITLTVTPSYPKPYQSVIVVPESSVIDLSASTVTVTVNGSEVSRGSGAEAAYVTVGGAGTATTVRVTAVTGGQTYTKTVVIRPAEVALVVESQSTTHPFYEGGSLIASSGSIRIVAVPDIRTSAGAPVPASNLVYTWRNRDQVLQGASGIGKSVLTASAPVLYRDAAITATVTTQDRSVVAEASVLIAPVEPFVLIYRNDPLLGPLFGEALPAEVALNGTEESFRAVPYFFSAKPSINWSINGLTNDNDQDITVRASGIGSGRAPIGVSASLQGTSESAGSGMSVTFGEPRSLGIFGL